MVIIISGQIKFLVLNAFTPADQGKDKLEWYRTVDAAKLEHLKDMMNAPDYKENLGTLIR